MTWLLWSYLSACAGLSLALLYILVRMIRYRGGYFNRLAMLALRLAPAVLLATTTLEALGAWHSPDAIGLIDLLRQLSLATIVTTVAITHSRKSYFSL